MDSIVENARAMNRKNGLDESLQDHYIHYDGDFIQRRKYNKWLVGCFRDRFSRCCHNWINILQSINEQAFSCYFFSERILSCRA
jgi:hypothetical protein